MKIVLVILVIVGLVVWGQSLISNAEQRHAQSTSGQKKAQ